MLVDSFLQNSIAFTLGDKLDKKMEIIVVVTTEELNSSNGSAIEQ